MPVIVWDEPKRQANLADRGLDFADLDEAFFLDAVVFAPLGTEGFSVVSMRPASRKERALL